MVATEDRPGWADAGRVPCLDGLRAVAVLGVVAYHAAPSLGLGGASRAVAVAWGGAGVDLFFALSGFLITLLMLRERDRAGRVDLRAFYARRALRIVPAYAAYLLAVAAMQAAGLVAIRPQGWAAALTYTSNLVPLAPSEWAVGHTWTLSAEEHFYLAWPLAFSRSRRPAAVLVAAFLAAPAARLLLGPGLGLWMLADLSTPARMGPIAGGCLLALAAHRGRVPGAAWGWPLLLGGLAAWVLGGLIPSWTLRVALGRSVASAGACAVLLACLAAPRSAFGRALGWRPAAWLGGLSYSLYLWQQPFTDPHSEAWMCRAPQDLALAFGCALLSHYAVERPSLRLKGRAGRARGGHAGAMVVIVPDEPRNFSAPPSV